MSILPRRLLRDYSIVIRKVIPQMIISSSLQLKFHNYLNFDSHIKITLVWLVIPWYKTHNKMILPVDSYVYYCLFLSQVVITLCAEKHNGELTSQSPKLALFLSHLRTCEITILFLLRISLSTKIHIHTITIMHRDYVQYIAKLEY